MPNSTREKKQGQEKTANARQYGKNKSFPLPVWNGILDHYNKMGPAIWEFLWLLDKITYEDENGVGWCLATKNKVRPIKASEIAKDLGKSADAVSEMLRRLSRWKYIQRVRTPYGDRIGVNHSRKFGVWSKHPRSKQSIEPAEPVEGPSKPETPVQAPDTKTTPEVALDDALEAGNSEVERYGVNATSENRDMASTPERYGVNATNKEYAARRSNGSGRSNETDNALESIRPSVQNQTDGRGVSQPSIPPTQPKTERQHRLDILNALQLTSSSHLWPASFDDSRFGDSPIELTSALYGWIIARIRAARKNGSTDPILFPKAYAIKAAREFFEQHYDWYQILERFLGSAEDSGFAFTSGSWIDSRTPIPIRLPPTENDLTNIAVSYIESRIRFNHGRPIAVWSILNHMRNHCVTTLHAQKITELAMTRFPDAAFQKSFRRKAK
jgi:hypothetical protein